MNWKIEVIEEITMDEASASETPETEFRLYFSEKATMIFFAFDWANKRYFSPTTDSLNYVYAETAMVFYFDLIKKVK